MDIVCRTCGFPVDDKHVLCRRCLEKRSHREVLAVQPDLLPRAMEGRVPMRLVKHAGREEEHIEMLYFAGHQGYCGVVFENPKKRKIWTGRFVPYAKIAEAHLCAECQAAFEHAAGLVGAAK